MWLPISLESPSFLPAVPLCSPIRGFLVQLCSHHIHMEDSKEGLYTLSQNHKMARVGRHLKDHEAPMLPPQAGHQPPHSILDQPAQGPSNLALDTSRDGALTSAGIGKTFGE